MHDQRADDIERLESEFPATSETVFADAQAKAIASGQSILISENGGLYEVMPTGEKRFLKKVAPPVDVVRGSKIELQ